MPALLQSLEQDALSIFSVLLLCLVLIKARPASTAGEAWSPSDFVRGLVIRTLLLLFGVGCLNLLVNPFGRHASRLFEPIVLSSRQTKIGLYERRRPAPEVVILGSSRSFMMSPAYIEVRAGRTAFNAAVQAAGPRDYLAFARYLATRRTLPQTFVVGLGVEQLIAQSSFVEARDPWGAYLNSDEPLRSRVLRMYGGLLSIEELSASVRVLAVELRGRPASLYEFDADGLTHVHGARPPSDQGVDESLAGNWGPAIFAPETLDPAPLAHLQQFLELSRQQQTRVVIYLPPYHPRATDRYVRESHFRSLRAQLLARLASWAKEYPIRLHDFTEVTSFGGSADMFYDASHPTDAACRLMVDAMLADLT